MEWTLELAEGENDFSLEAPIPPASRPLLIYRLSVRVTIRTWLESDRLYANQGERPVTPTMLGQIPTMLGQTPTMLGTTPTMHGSSPSMLGATPIMLLDATPELVLTIADPPREVGGGG